MMRSNGPITMKNWQQKVITPFQVLNEIKPGMRIFLSTGNLRTENTRQTFDRFRFAQLNRSRIDTIGQFG